MVTERSQPNGVKLKMIERKLRIGVNWQGALKIRLKINGRKTRTGCTFHFIIHQ